MNRREEYWSLVAALRELPPELEGAADRARTRKRRRARRLGIPVVSLAGAVSAFVLLVNCSAPFAMACRRVPVVRELAEAVALSPSLRAALEHDYFQYTGKSQNQGGVTVTVEGLIVDRTSLHLFYTLSSDGERQLEATPTLRDAAGNPLDYVAAWSDGGGEDGYRLATFFFPGGTAPSSLRVCFAVQETGHPKDAAGPEPAPEAGGAGGTADLSSFSFFFDLTVDPSLLGPGRTVELGRWVELDGQRLYLESLSIDPTRMALTLREDPDNTALLTGLECYAEDESGRRYGRPGVTYGGGTLVQLESCYFSGCEHLTLTLTAAQWLDKEGSTLTLDLQSGRADGLPEGMDELEVERRGRSVYLSFRNDRQTVRFAGEYLDPEGGEHSWEGAAFSATDEDGDGVCETATEHRVLRDYPWESVTIPLLSNRETRLQPAVSLPLF